MILSRKTAEDKNEDDPDDNQEEAALGEITWDWGRTPVPTVDLLYPDESPEDNARWYWELHQSRPRTTPRKAISNTKNKFKSNIYTEDEMYCKLCFHEGQPVSVVRSHPNLDIKVVHEDILCQGIFFEWLETLTYLMTKTLQCLSAHESPSDEAK